MVGKKKRLAIPKTPLQTIDAKMSRVKLSMAIATSNEVIEGLKKQMKTLRRQRRKVIGKTTPAKKPKNPAPPKKKRKKKK